VKRGLSEYFRERVSRLSAAHPLAGRCWIAYSGGLDSSVLLHLAAGLRGECANPNAIHVHHGLHPLADDWAEHCREQCAALSIPLWIKKVDAHPAPGESPEAAARLARYAALTGCLAPGEAVLSAQHGDDQAETLLLQLLRGAGPAGLAAMPEAAPLGRGWLLRPLLGCSRAELQAYAEANGLSWIEDSSNQDTRFDRNFLRHQVLPLVRQRWPGLRRTLSRAAAHQARAAGLLEELAEQDGRECVADLPPLLARLFPRLRALSIPALEKLPGNPRFPLARQENLLRAWLAGQGFAAPPAARVHEILQEMIEAGADRQPLIAWPGGTVRRYRDLLLALPPLPAPPGALLLTWRPAEELILPLGRLRMTGDISAPLNVRFRRGGETCRARGLTRSLKNLMQDAGVPAWLRDFTPLVHAGEELAVVPGVVTAEGFEEYAVEWSSA
jgi:tRNA(Ile)-lysidine synthase